MTDGLTILVHTPEADGHVGRPTTYAAWALLAGRAAALPFSMPFRCRLTLIAEDDTLHFKIEELKRLPDNEPSLAAAHSAVLCARQTGCAVYATDQLPNVSVMEALQACCIEARTAALESHRGVTGRVAADAEAQLDVLQRELRFWWLFVRISAEQRSWQDLAATFAMPNSGPSSWNDWCGELHRRARRIASRVEELLKTRPMSIGPLPTPAEVAAAWTSPDAVAVHTGVSATVLEADAEATAHLRTGGGLKALRGVAVPRLVRLLHHTLLETGKLTSEPSWVHESFGLMNFLADERYRLYDCFDRADLAEMLRRFRASALEILAFS
jgi:hypothetical protein